MTDHATRNWNIPERTRRYELGNEMLFRLSFIPKGTEMHRFLILKELDFYNKHRRYGYR